MENEGEPAEGNHHGDDESPPETPRVRLHRDAGALEPAPSTGPCVALWPPCREGSAVSRSMARQSGQLGYPDSGARSCLTSS